jgi:hypothetical protein
VRKRGWPTTTTKERKEGRKEGADGGRARARFSVSDDELSSSARGRCGMKQELL